MALKALMLRKNIDDKKKELEKLEERSKELTSRREELQKRETELEVAVGEVQTEEEKATVTIEIEAYQKDDDALTEEEQELAREKEELESEVEELEKELEEEERSIPSPKPETKERKEITVMESRTKFYGMTLQERDAFFENEDVKSFLSEVRTCIKEQRALTNVGLTIPDVMLPLLRQVATETSKLASKVNKQNVGGKARQNIMGTIPEAVWTEMCANLNELDLSFNNAEVDGYKVGGFFAVCNAVLEDSDEDLVSILTDAIGKAIGKALDKAIVYGSGTKMPLGIVTRLAQTSQPEGYPATARTWADLHTSNVKTGTGATGLNLFKEIVSNTDAIENDYFENDIVWLMNKKTHNKLTVEAMGANANAAIVSGMSKEMPVIGGEIIELPFIPDNNVICGYFEAYLLAERAGTTLGQSEHVRFLNDQTVFKGTARYDGMPVIAEAFEVFTITNTAPTTSGIPFPSDEANPS